MKNPIPDRFRSGWLDWRRRRFWAWVLLVAYTLVGFVILPWYARGAIVDAVHESLGLDARLTDVDVNPFALSARLEDFAILDRQGEVLVSFRDFYANFQLSSLFRRAWTFADLSIVEPFANVERDPDGAFNLAALTPAGQEAAAGGDDVGADTESAPLRLIVDRLAVVEGRADFTDRSSTETYDTTFGPIDVTVTHLNTLPDQEGQQQITIVGEGGARLTWNGTVSVNPLRSTGKVQLADLRLRRLSAYVPADVGARIASGTLDVAFAYGFTGGKSLAANVDALALALKELRVESRNATDDAPALLELPALSLTGGRFAWPAREISIARVALEQPAVALSRDADGRFTWDTLIESDVAPAADDADASEVPTTAAPGDHRPAWAATLDRFEIAGGTVRFTDGTLEPNTSFGVEAIDVGVDRVTLAEGARMPFAVGLAVSGGGTVALRGEVQALPAPALDVHVDVTDLALPTAQPYVAQTTLLTLDAGTLDLSGDIAYAPDRPLAFKGDAAVDAFSLNRAESGDRIAEWKRLAVDGIDADTATRRIDVARVVLDGAYARVRVDREGTINVSRLLKSPPTTESTPAESAPPAEAPAVTESATPWTIRLRRLDVADASSDYRDDSLPIPFIARISSFEGRLSALDTSSARPADIAFEGKVGDYGLVRVEGALQPLAVEENTLFTAKFENVDLRDATPYTIRFAGRKIESGKLDLDSRYEVKKRNLRATHDIVLRDFKLGEKVESPDAMNLPLDLAVSLLKGPDGTIEVELPIEGNVDDPEFRIGGIIRQAIFNLITKIVTAPFRLLGMLLGMGEDVELDRVEFPPGRADLSPPQQETIGKLAEALRLRPELQLTVPAVSATAEDTAALKRARVGARIDEATAGMDPSAVRKAIEALAVGIVAEEERAAIETRHTTAKTETAEAAFDEAAYVGELVDRLVAIEPVTADDIVALALARRDAVIGALRALPGVAPERVKEADVVEVKPKGDAVPLTFDVDAMQVPSPGATSAPAIERADDASATETAPAIRTPAEAATEATP